MALCTRRNQRRDIHRRQAVARHLRSMGVRCSAQYIGRQVASRPRGCALMLRATNGLYSPHRAWRHARAVAARTRHDLRDTPQVKGKYRGRNRPPWHPLAEGSRRTPHDLPAKLRPVSWCHWHPGGRCWRPDVEALEHVQHHRCDMPVQQQKTCQRADCALGSNHRRLLAAGANAVENWRSERLVYLTSTRSSSRRSIW